MTDQSIPAIDAEASDVYPTHVSLAEYLDTYSEHHFEWDNGRLIKLAPITATHNDLVGYFLMLLSVYFELRPIGKFMIAAFLMRIDSLGLMFEPDLQIIRYDNPGEFTNTGMLGPADICIEIIAPERRVRSAVTKLLQYEQVGVKEFWLIDYEHQGAHFYRLNEEGVYNMQYPVGSIYETPLLPGLRINVADLWLDPLPGPGELIDSVRVMLGEV